MREIFEISASPYQQYENRIIPAHDMNLEYETGQDIQVTISLVTVSYPEKRCTGLGIFNLLGFSDFLWIP